MSSAPLRGGVLRWVPGRIPLSLHAPGKAAERAARASQQPFPGRLERSEAEWKAIRDPAQDSRSAAPAEEAFAVARNGAGIEELAARLAVLAPAVVAIEATGGFETIVAAGLAGAGLPVVVVNPAQIRAYAKAIKQRAKTDPIDAAVIAKFARATRPEVRPLPDKATRQLADLVARRRQIVEMIVASTTSGWQ